MRVVTLHNFSQFLEFTAFAECSYMSLIKLHCVKDNGHRWRTREGTCNLVIGRSELGLVEGANAAPTPIKEVVEISER